jgi:ABC-type uncharacterized transport system substrate-binding protein
MVQDLKAAAPSLLIELTVVGVRTPTEIDAALSAVSRAHTQALYALEGPFFVAHRTMLLKFSSKARLPTMFAQRGAVDAGGLKVTS